MKLYQLSEAIDDVAKNGKAGRDVTILGLDVTGIVYCQGCLQYHITVEKQSFSEAHDAGLKL